MIYTHVFVVGGVLFVVACEILNYIFCPSHNCFFSQATQTIIRGGSR